VSGRFIKECSTLFSVENLHSIEEAANLVRAERFIEPHDRQEGYRVKILPPLRGSFCHSQKQFWLNPRNPIKHSHPELLFGARFSFYIALQKDNS
jgi:hypothetical protein